MGAYVRLLLKLGWQGSTAIAGRYLRASHRLLAECRLNTSAAARQHARAARARLSDFARRTGLSEERLSSLQALYVPPAVQRFGLMMRSLYLDRIVCGLIGILGLLLAGVLLVFAGAISALCSVLVAALALGYALVGSGENCSPQATMLQNAAHIAELFSARWVVMGHTHQPIMQAVSASASYVNLGSWGEDDPPDERVARASPLGTFLVLRKRSGEFLAELMRWDTQHGPQSLELTEARSH
jgi:hypothetical protein